MSLYKKFMNEWAALHVFESLKNSSMWNDGIKSRYGISRKQCHYDILPEYLQSLILELVNIAFTELNFIRDENNGIGILSIYLNYYRNGDDFCPKHRHLGTK